jgi:hypothetical protein
MVTLTIRIEETSPNLIILQILNQTGELPRPFKPYHDKNLMIRPTSDKMNWDYGIFNISVLWLRHVPIQKWDTRRSFLRGYRYRCFKRSFTYKQYIILKRHLKSNGINLVLKTNLFSIHRNPMAKF